jgi:hypothetical protein
MAARVESGGGGGGEVRGLAGCKGAPRLFGGQGSTATSLGARAGLGRSEWQGEAWNGPVVCGGSPAGPRVARGKGQDFEAASVGAWPREGRPRDAGGPRR